MEVKLRKKGSEIELLGKNRFEIKYLDSFGSPIRQTHTHTLFRKEHYQCDRPTFHETILSMNHSFK